ncbi:SpoIIE family protein phosphatase [Luteolibacter pohnpeiensis]|uniref:SpoIIE family protein phosphatase n=1 Tax=Luteolibacter pohnpeiensis TaxID=454153 RepID=A0A934VT41_9BACT|nr:SpoIIE family protein phosphatase [Luteolibacter pohnpeiensis]MBK1881092.1 SpoIIE family protein phosphatase [Luteolibacter pohnpeiensis]
MDIGDEAASNRCEVNLERLNLALRASNEGIWDWQTAEADIYYSHRILEFFGCEAGQAPNLFLPPFESIHPDDRVRFEQTLARALAPGGPDTLAIDAQVQAGSGVHLWLRIRGTVLRDEAGNATRIAGSMIDISRRKFAESQLEEERFLLRQLIDNVPLQIYFKNLESRFTLTNKRMAEWMGLEKPEDMLGKHDRDFFEDDHSRAAEDDERNIVETRQPIVGKLEHETWHEGEETWVTSSKFPWLDRNGNIRGTFGVSGDVTELVRTRQEAVVLAGELQKRNEAYEEELHLAREVQQALASSGFPKVSGPEGDALHFSSRYIPISGLAGDFFEVIPISDHEAGMLICDVMGHGVRAALIVAMLRGLLEKQRAQAADPSQFLKGLNDGLSAILDRAGASMFATAFYAVVNLKTDTLKYACAGHPGPVAAGSNGVYQLAFDRSERGPGLGLIKGAAYPSNKAKLAEIDRIILFTDGVLEAENQVGEPFFENRLMELISEGTGQTLDEMLDGILSTVLAFSEGKRFDDDVCLLAVEMVRKPQPQSSRSA